MDPLSIETKLWNLYERIEQLGEIKIELIDIIQANISSSNFKNIYIQDLNESYYNLLTSWELLQGSIDNSEYLISARASHQYSLSKYKQFISEIEHITMERSENRSIDGFKETFMEVHALIGEIFGNVLISEPPIAPNKLTERVDQNHFNILCSICGEKTAKFYWGSTHFFPEKSYFYKGLLHTRRIGNRYMDKVVSLLEKENLDKLHRILVDNMISEEGIDSFCPECNKTYCTEHLQMIEEWDEGFYDYTLGTCPEGHTRIIDD